MSTDTRRPERAEPTPGWTSCHEPGRGTSEVWGVPSVTSPRVGFLNGRCQDTSSIEKRRRRNHEENIKWSKHTCKRNYRCCWSWIIFAAFLRVRACHDKRLSFFPPLVTVEPASFAFVDLLIKTISILINVSNHQGTTSLRKIMWKIGIEESLVGMWGGALPS